MSAPEIKLYSPQELETIAEIFLKKYHNPPDSLPIKIDVIIQRGLEVDIFPKISLEQMYGLHGYLALSLKTIYIDQYIMNTDTFDRRYRFTLAEEVAHLILHKDLFKGVETPEDYIDAYDRIDENKHRQMDLDAKRLGEAILVPAEMFRKEALMLATDLSSDRLFNKLADKFNVSTYVVGYRFRHLGLVSQIEL